MTLFQGIDSACQTFVIRFGPFVQPREFVAEAFDGRLEMRAELVANGHEVRFRRIRLERSLELRSEFLPRRIRSQLFAELACELAGAATAAALLSRAVVPEPGQTVAAVVSGGNVAPETAAAILAADEA